MVVALGLAAASLALPGTAASNLPAPPSIEVIAPASGGSYAQQEAINAVYSCAPAEGATLQSCAGPVPTGSPFDTSTFGPHSFTVEAEDSDGGKAIQTVGYGVECADHTSSCIEPIAPGIRVPAKSEVIHLRLAHKPKQSALEGRMVNVRASFGHCSGEPLPTIISKVVERPRTPRRPHGAAIITVSLSYPEWDRRASFECADVQVNPFPGKVRLKRTAAGLFLFDGSYSPPRRVRPPVKTAGAVHRRSHTCGPANGETLLAEPKARIYGAGGLNPLEPGRPERVYGCLVSTGRSIKLSPLPRTSRWGAPVMYGPFALDAPWAAGGVGQQTGRDSRENSISARNLRSGQRKSCYVGNGHSPRASGGVRSIVLKRNGSFAWSGHSRIGEVTGGELPPPKVVACDSTGEHVLDSGPGIDLHSLKLQGSRLTWIDADPQSA